MIASGGKAITICGLLLSQAHATGTGYKARDIEKF
jgi:hypothetical protein